jgi:uncharacterized protein
MRESASRLAAEKARAVLETLHWERPCIEVVAGAIESHSDSAGIVPASLEGRILQDADRLDAIGLTELHAAFTPRAAGAFVSTTHRTLGVKNGRLAPEDSR